MHVKTITNFTINSKTEIVTKRFLESLTRYKSILTSLNFLKLTILTNKTSTSKTSASISQMSKYYSLARIHLRISFFKFLNPLYRSSDFSKPQPNYLEKSFPVPIGITPIGTLVTLISFATSYVTTHITVPSPPHTIA